MRVAPLLLQVYIILLCRPVSSSKSSPFVRYPFNVHLSNPHPAISPCWKIVLLLPLSCLRFLTHDGLVNWSIALSTRELPRADRFICHRRCSTGVPIPPMLHLPEEEVGRSSSKLSAFTAPRLERALLFFPSADTSTLDSTPDRWLLSPSLLRFVHLQHQVNLSLRHVRIQISSQVTQGK